MAKKFNPSSAADRFAKLSDEVKKAQKKAERTEMIPVSSIIFRQPMVKSKINTYFASIIILFLLFCKTLACL